jgi:polyisoprenyl-teichoic acid--peptidoglycan teichoic acid transferase
VHRQTRPRLRRALLLTAASAVLPGTAHLAAGRRRAGTAIAAAAAAALASLLVLAARTPRADFLRLAVQPRWLTVIAAAAAVLAVAWIAVVLSSYIVLRPERVSAGGKVLVAATLALLCVAVAVPPALVARYAFVQHGVISSVFPDSDVSAVDGSGHGGGADPWGGRERLNVVLIASDSGPDRFGTRTDSLVLASIDVRTADVVLFSLPRNLENVPMPAGPLAQTWPDGFPDLLNSVYEHVHGRPKLLRGARDRGAEAVKLVVGEILGLRVDYYVLANLAGFERFVDALGGVTLTVQQRLPIGGLDAYGNLVPPAGYIKPGRQKLDGYHALWYARSRRDSSDYDRIERQRCLLGALARQADPVTVLRNFQALAEATKRLMSTDIPQDLLPSLVDLAEKVRTDGSIRSLPFVPPLINTGRPDYRLIRTAVRRALAPPAPKPSAAPGDQNGGAGPDGQVERSADAAPTVSPTPHGPRKIDSATGRGRSSSPAEVDEVCGFD